MGPLVEGVMALVIIADETVLGGDIHSLKGVNGSTSLLCYAGYRRRRSNL
jgi:hypothetical protein